MDGGSCNEKNLSFVSGSNFFFFSLSLSLSIYFLWEMAWQLVFRQFLKPSRDLANWFFSPPFPWLGRNKLDREREGGRNTHISESLCLLPRTGRKERRERERAQPPTVLCKMEAQLEYIYIHNACMFLRGFVRICMPSRQLLTKKNLHRSSVGSLLRVRCWLGGERERQRERERFPVCRRNFDRKGRFRPRNSRVFFFNPPPSPTFLPSRPDISVATSSIRKFITREWSRVLVLYSIMSVALKD